MKKAFTLAEVLITLAIIGVVAALTIPSVIANTQQQEFKTGLRKAVSALNSAIATNIALEGDTPLDATGNPDGLFEYLQRHMSILKSCRIGTPDHTNDAFYTTDGMRFETTLARVVTKKLHEGPEITFAYNSRKTGYNLKGCGSYGLKNNPNNTVNPPCFVVVDVNGDKKPSPSSVLREEAYGEDGTIRNFAGTYKYSIPDDKRLTDVFLIMITEDKAIPFGVVAQRAMYGK